MLYFFCVNFSKGEAQKVEHLTHAFSIRYIDCNRAECKKMFNVHGIQIFLWDPDFLSSVS